MYTEGGAESRHAAGTLCESSKLMLYCGPGTAAVVCAGGPVLVAYDGRVALAESVVFLSHARLFSGMSTASKLYVCTY